MSQSTATIRQEFVNAKQAAAMLKCTPYYARRLASRGVFAGAYEPFGSGRGWLIPWASVQARIAKKKAGKLSVGGRPIGIPWSANDLRRRKKVEKPSPKSR